VVGKSEVRAQSEGLAVYGRKTLNAQGVRMWTGFIWLRMRTGGRLVYIKLLVP
jgi:hypothetical protein